MGFTIQLAMNKKIYTSIYQVVKDLYYSPRISNTNFLNNINKILVSPLSHNCADMRVNHDIIKLIFSILLSILTEGFFLFNFNI